ncbi:hypothetical protein ACL02S_08210 [Nocardia sp. 004]|uniref:hypothetical protein n=1 Tax=Nocardia sp. 004 TaxID=3385978 RepID=UPI0039A19A8E
MKDMIALTGHTPSYGLAAWRSTHPPSETTAPVLERLLAAGGWRLQPEWPRTAEGS